VLSLPFYFGLVNGAALVGVARPRLEPFDEVHPERSQRAQEKLRRRVSDGQEVKAMEASPELDSEQPSGVIGYLLLVFAVESARVKIGNCVSKQWGVSEYVGRGDRRNLQ